MAINYPVSKDTASNVNIRPIATDSMTAGTPVGGPTVIDNLYSEIEALQTKVGINADPNTTSLDYKLSTVGTGERVESQSALYRQALINGNFDIWQRGVSFASTALGAPLNRFGYVADRFFDQIYATGGATGDFTFTVSQQAFTPGQIAVPNEPKFFHRILLTGLATLGTVGALFRTVQRIEGVRNFAGKKMTVSMWVKADTNRIFMISSIQSFGTGGSPSAPVSVPGGTSISVTTSWQKFTVTFTVPSIAGKTIGTNGDDFIDVTLLYYKQDDTTYSIPSGVVGTYATGTFDIAQWICNAGDVSLPLSPKSFDEELKNCMRYYEKSYDYSIQPGTGGNYYNGCYLLSVGSAVTGTLSIVVPFKVKKRAIPSIILYDPNGNVGACYRGAFGKTATAVAIGETAFTAQCADATSSPSFNGNWTAEIEL